MKIIIAGGRDFNNYEAMKSICDKAFSRQKKSDLIIVSGMCETGADALGIRYAKENGIFYEPFYADWNKHGKAAGPIRNSKMADYADGLIVFWDMMSKGSKDMIYKAIEKDLKIKLYLYGKEKIIYAPIEVVK